MLSHEHFMRQALAEAQEAFAQNEIPVGCVIASGNKIIARGHNEVERLTDVTAHAEMMAITAAQIYLGAKYLEGCDMYVTLEPCVMCAGAIFWARPSRLIIAAPDTERGFLRFGKQLLHPRTEVVTGILENEAAQLVSDFFKNIRRR